MLSSFTQSPDNAAVYRTLEDWFKRHPLRMPIFLIVFGAAFSVLQLASGVFFIFASGLGVLSFVVGVIVLPFGIVTTIRRRRPVPLVCPHCGTASLEAPYPFQIERLEYVDYVHVTCSQCGRDFTTDKYQNLV